MLSLCVIRRSLHIDKIHQNEFHSYNIYILCIRIYWTAL